MVNLNCAINQKFVFNNKEEGVVNSVNDGILHVQIGDKERRFDISAVANGYLVFLDDNTTKKVKDEYLREKRVEEIQKEKIEKEMSSRVFVFYDEFIGFVKEQFNRIKPLFPAIFFNVDFNNEVLSSDKAFNKAIRESAGVKFSLSEYGLKGQSAYYQNYDEENDEFDRTLQQHLWDEICSKQIERIEKKGKLLGLDKITLDEAVNLFCESVVYSEHSYDMELKNINLKQLIQIAKDNYKKCMLWIKLKYEYYNKQ